MSSYHFEIQKAIIAASMAIHNFIRREASTDEQFEIYDRALDFIQDDDPDITPYFNVRIDNDEGDMDRFRNELATNIANSLK